MTKFYLLPFLLTLNLSLLSQNIYEVTPSPFTPPEQEMVRQFEGFPTMPIEATDVSGKKVIIPSPDYTSQLLWFTTIEKMNASWLKLMGELNTGKNYELIIFINDKKNALTSEDLSKYQAFTIVPNSKMLSEAVFGSELGPNRGFMVDGSGVIQKVFLAKELVQKEDIVSYIQSFNP